MKLKLNKEQAFDWFTRRTSTVLLGIGMVLAIPAFPFIALAYYLDCEIENPFREENGKLYSDDN